MGLVPIGPDPESGLWEFWHVGSGERPERDAQGKLVLEERTGVVLVLLPGGSFTMGAQDEDPRAPNYDPRAMDNESPPHGVVLSPFFISKFELTQAQWVRQTGHNPSYFQNIPVAPNGMHPVEQVSWLDCQEVLARMGLQLPTEAQWEYAARAGTDTPWWTGAERESLQQQGAANLADQAAAREGFAWTEIRDWPELDDGWPVHAPVGSLAPNPLGLHDVHGNLWEWCLDGFDERFYRSSPTSDPVCPPGQERGRVNRGGSFYSTASGSRSAKRALRVDNAPASTGINLGVRPGRPVLP
jgi:formylglycine-generating enzyme required for sulfatase activity